MPRLYMVRLLILHLRAAFPWKWSYKSQDFRGNRILSIIHLLRQSQTKLQSEKNQKFRISYFVKVR